MSSFSKAKGSSRNKSHIHFSQIIVIKNCICIALYNLQSPFPFHYLIWYSRQPYRTDVHYYRQIFDRWKNSGPKRFNHLLKVALWLRMHENQLSFVLGKWGMEVWGSYNSVPYTFWEENLTAISLFQRVSSVCWKVEQKQQIAQWNWHDADVIDNVQ